MNSKYELEIGDYIGVFFDGVENQHMIGPITGWIDGGCIIRDCVEVIYKNDELMYIEDVEEYLEDENE